MDDEKVVETAPVEEETAPVETVEETAPVEETTPEETDNGEAETKALIQEVLTEVKGLVALLTTEPTIEVEEDGSNDTNVDELESQLDDLDF